MLNLTQIVAEIGEMGRAAGARTNRIAEQLGLVMQQATLTGTAWDEARSRIPAGRASPWLAAVCGADPPARIVTLPGPIPSVYTALATDGSQIPLDRHAIAPCYLLNIGEIALHYGLAERPRMTTRATLHYKDEEIYLERGSLDPVMVDARFVANQRLLEESSSLGSLIQEFESRHGIALVDDPLIVWTPQGESRAEQQRIVQGFCALLETGFRARMPVAGYMSRPGHRDVVGALRLTLCKPECAHRRDDPCRSPSHLTDAQLYSFLLRQPGDRSPVFGSGSSALDDYPVRHRVQFFYLNVGSEIARVEVPRWVADDAGLLDRVHRLTMDQAVKGRGYPAALMEAHERAVVRGPDREAFFRLVEAAFVRERAPVLRTRKALSKNVPIL